MGAHLSLAPNIGTAHRLTIKNAFSELKRRTLLASAAAAPTNAKFNTWFCPNGALTMPRILRNAQGVLRQMNHFLNGNVSYTLFVSASTVARTAGATYGFVYPDLQLSTHLRPGSQLIIYLGTGWNAPLGVAQTDTGATHGRSTPVQVLAHELSHHFGTNGANINRGAYAEEQYDHAALDIVGLVSASYNADNYGYFIEEM